MSDLLLNILPGTLAQDCYPASADAYQKNLLTIARVVFPGTIAGIAIGPTPPTNHDIPWARTDSSGNFIRIYTWGGYGVWVSQHVELPSSPKRFLWIGLEADLITFDEGTSDPITETTGAFWIVDHAFDARYLIGPGALPSGKTIAPKDTGGEETHVLTPAETAVPTHKHLNAMYVPSANTDYDHGTGNKPVTPGEAVVATSSFANAVEPYTGGAESDPPSIPVTGHNNLPPYYGVFVIRRSQRIYYTV